MITAFIVRLIGASSEMLGRPPAASPRWLRAVGRVDVVFALQEEEHLLEPGDPGNGTASGVDQRQDQLLTIVGQRAPPGGGTRKSGLGGR